MTSDNTKYIFLNILEDIRFKVASGNKYNIIRAAGLVRQLLLDREPIVYQVNREFTTKILYEVRDLSNLPKESLTQSTKEESTIQWFHLIPVDNKKKVSLKIDEFLSHKILIVNQHIFTVRDIIQFTSTFLGGIHNYKTKIDEEKEFTKIKLKLNGIDINLQCLLQICVIVVESLKNLEELVKISVR